MATDTPATATSDVAIPEPPPRRRPPVVAAAASIAIIPAAFALAAWLGPKGVFDDGPPLGAQLQANGQVIVVRVQQGEGLASLGTRLETMGVIRSARLFRALVTLRGLEGTLQAGDYEFERGEPVGRVVDRLYRGATAELQVTLPEGRRLEEEGTLLEQNKVAGATEFAQAAGSHDYPYDFLKDIPKVGTLEGFLFPDTYQFSKRASPEDVVGLMLGTFQRKVLTDDVRADLARSPLSLYQVVTLASIVEREASVPEEQPVIASVFLNRIRQGIPLQADPTVQYAVARDPYSVRQFGYWKRDLTERDLALDSPYNTYQVRGLPPGPIANPGRDAIVAVLRPAKTDYLYFVAKPDGTHAFAATLEEHNRNVARYQGR